MLQTDNGNWMLLDKAILYTGTFQNVDLSGWINDTYTCR